MTWPWTLVTLTARRWRVGLCVWSRFRHSSHSQFTSHTKNATQPALLARPRLMRHWVRCVHGRQIGPPLNPCTVTEGWRASTCASETSSRSCVPVECSGAWCSSHRTSATPVLVQMIAGCIGGDLSGESMYVGHERDDDDDDDDDGVMPMLSGSLPGPGVEGQARKALDTFVIISVGREKSISPVAVSSSVTAG